MVFTDVSNAYKNCYKIIRLLYMIVIQYLLTKIIIIKKDMDNNNTQMENWKKLIIMDPTLNVLFDPNVSAQDLLIGKILTLPHQDIVNLYSKLAALKHSLSRSLQKEVQTKQKHIQKSFQSAIQYRRQFDETGNIQINDHISYLKKFNSKYKTVSQSLTYWRNVTKVLNFSKALETFRVNTNILKTLMRGYNGQQATINPYKVAKIIKQLYYLSTHHDFSGLQYFQNQKIFISNTKTIVHEIAKKSIQKTLVSQIIQNPTQSNSSTDLNNWIEVFLNLNTLRDFITSYFKLLLAQLAEKVKQTFKQQSIRELDYALESRLVPFILQSCFCFIKLEESLIKFRRSQLSQNIPNLFIKIWQKFTEYCGQIFMWTRKQQIRNHPKNRQQLMTWKYPVIYKHFSSLCNICRQKLLVSITFGWYNFGNLQQKLMLTILDIGTDYHKQCITSFAIKKQSFSADNLTEYFVSIQKIFQQCPSTAIIVQQLAQYLQNAIIQYEDQFIKSNSCQEDQNINLSEQIKNGVVKILKKQQIKHKNILSVRQLAYFHQIGSQNRKKQLQQ